MTLSGWIPIADAPRDGTWVKVSCVRRTGLHVAICKWSRPDRPGPARAPYWMTTSFGNRFASGIVEPTHYMPLTEMEGAL